MYFDRKDIGMKERKRIVNVKEKSCKSVNESLKNK